VTGFVFKNRRFASRIGIREQSQQ